MGKINRGFTAAESIDNAFTEAVSQIVYLDFDGELTAYNGELLTIDGVEVAHANLDAKRITTIIDELNELFAAQGVLFTATKPESGEYSTVFVGKSDAFAELGTIRGIAETIDEDNRNKRDNAFVLLDATSENSAIINTIAHEVCHLLGDRHAGDGIAAYLAGGTLTVAGGDTVSDIVLSSGVVEYQYMTLYGTANDTVIRGGGVQNVWGTARRTEIAGGSQYIFDGGVASNTELNNGAQYVSSGAATRNTAVKNASQYILSGGVASNTSLRGTYPGYGYQTISSGGVASNTTIYDRGCQIISSGGRAG